MVEIEIVQEMIKDGLFVKTEEPANFFRMEDNIRKIGDAAE